MAQKDRKIRKRFGTRTVGKGMKGSRRRDGGRGLAGSHKHKYTWIIKYDPEHFGTHGFGRGGLKREQKGINVGDLSELCMREGLDEIDVSGLGYDKVLGRGDVKRRINVKSKAFSKTAKEKIEKVGGKAILKARRSQEEKEPTTATEEEREGEEEK